MRIHFHPPAFFPTFSSSPSPQMSLTQPRSGGEPQDFHDIPNLLRAFLIFPICTERLFPNCALVLLPCAGTCNMLLRLISTTRPSPLANASEFSIFRFCNLQRRHPSPYPALLFHSADPFSTSTTPALQRQPHVRIAKPPSFPHPQCRFLPSFRRPALFPPHLQLPFLPSIGSGAAGPSQRKTSLLPFSLFILYM